MNISLHSFVLNIYARNKSQEVKRFNPDQYMFSKMWIYHIFCISLYAYVRFGESLTLFFGPCITDLNLKFQNQSKNISEVHSSSPVKI